MGANPADRRPDGRAGVGEDRVDRRGRRIGGSLRVVGAEIGGDRDRVERPAHALDHAVGHPIVRRPAARHPHEPRRLSGEHARPDVEIAFRLVAGHLPVVEAGVLRQPGLIHHPLRRLESPAEVPDLVRPFDVHLPARLEIVAHVGGEVADERVVGHVGHVEPGIGVEVVGEPHHVFDRHAIGERLARGAVDARALPDVVGVAAIGPGADVGRVRLLHRHEADRAERRQPLAKERMERREGGPRAPALAGEALAGVVGHPDVEIPHRIGRARLLDPHQDAVVAGGHLKVGEGAAGGGTAGGDHAGVEAERHDARAVPLGAIGPGGVGGSRVSEHERRGDLSDRLAGRVHAAREHRGVAVGIDADGVRRAHVPRGFPGGGVELLGDPAA